MNTLIESIAKAIATMEGFFIAGTPAQRQNNPGNLRSWGSYPVVNGLVQFPDAATGWQALYDQVKKNISRGLNLQEFFGGQRDADGNLISGKYPGYAPAADKNDPRGYAQYVAGQVGVSPTTPLNAIGEPPGNPPQPPKSGRRTSGQGRTPR